MPASALRGALVLFLILYCDSSQSAQERRLEADMSQGSSWGLEVLTLKPTESTLVWVGLINRSEHARLVCILNYGLSFTERDGTSKAQGEGGSPHGCEADEQFLLLRAGQSLFVRHALPVGLAERVSGPIRIELGVIDRSVAATAPRRVTVDVSWEGTLQQAADLGRLVAGATTKAK
jgi:hypothetical protein